MEAERGPRRRRSDADGATKRGGRGARAEAEAERGAEALGCGGEDGGGGMRRHGGDGGLVKDEVDTLEGLLQQVPV